MPKVNNPGIIDIKIKPKERIVTKKLYVNRENIWKTCNLRANFIY